MPGEHQVGPSRRHHLTSHDVARLLAVSASAVNRWIDLGYLPAYRTPGGHRRIERGALLRFLRKEGMPVPVQLRRPSRVLVVDDEPAFLSSAKRLLGRAAPGAVVETARGSPDALLRIVTFSPDAVLLDAHMRGIDGAEVCKRLTRAPATAHIRVIGVTGRPSPGLERSYERAGAVTLLGKPLAVAELLAALGLADTHGVP